MLQEFKLETSHNMKREGYREVSLKHHPLLPPEFLYPGIFKEIWSS
jgi:hypothetical protein